MNWANIALRWTVLIIAIVAPIGAAATSPLLEWRDPIYIAGGFAGVIAMALLLVQPILAAGYLPGLTPRHSRIAHQWVGTVLVLMVIIHVIGLWITSPPDVLDALLLAAPTPFSIWGVIAMWAVFAVACLAVLRRRLRLQLRTWHLAHRTFAVVIIISTVLHAIMIEGTMEIVTKSILCALILVATLITLAALQLPK